MENIQQFVKITVFDDGNKPVPECDNMWIITDTMFNGGKLQLVNLYNEQQIINSISSWKVLVVDEEVKKSNQIGPD
tara:strand:+ start:20 stop:247 length:228 start_codon:yes stop_codon:yes gene_type:complete